jgi:hypothetical protein
MSNRETTFIKTKTEETTTIKPIPPAAKKPEEPAKEPAAQEPTPPEAATEKRGAETAKRLFGSGAKGKFTTQNTSKDSREAASDALKRLFQTRKP